MGTAKLVTCVCGFKYTVNRLPLTCSCGHTSLEGIDTETGEVFYVRAPVYFVPKEPLIHGPGYYLTQLLSPIKNAASWMNVNFGGCQCSQYADEMDRNGVEWCEQNIETIVGWLREGAEKHSLPFSAMMARWFVRHAISRTRGDQVRAANLG